MFLYRTPHAFMEKDELVNARVEEMVKMNVRWRATGASPPYCCCTSPHEPAFHTTNTQSMKNKMTEET